jgi:hypothetical protein
VGYDAVCDGGEGAGHGEGVASEAPDGGADARGDHQDRRVRPPEARGPRVGRGGDGMCPGEASRRREAGGEEGRPREMKRHCSAEFAREQRPRNRAGR